MAIALSTKTMSRTMAVEAKRTASADETPILRLLRAWEALNAAADTYVVDDNLGLDEKDELFDSLFFDRADEIAKELMALPCTCASDFAAKLIVDTNKGTCIQEWRTGDIWAEARALTYISQ